MLGLEVEARAEEAQSTVLLSTNATLSFLIPESIVDIVKSCTDIFCHLTTVCTKARSFCVTFDK
jgi:hypothetical protein